MTVAVGLLVLGLMHCVQAYPALSGVEDSDSGGYSTKVVCFVSASNEQYDSGSLVPGLCTHLILIDLVGLNSEGKLLLLQSSSRALTQFLELKRRFREVGDPASFMLAIGGVNQKSSHFSRAISEQSNLYNVVDNVVSFVTKHGFDGVDIAWFYPGQFGGRTADKANLVFLLEELQLRLQACGMSLSLTVGVDPRDIEISYDVPKIDEHVDFVNLLTGDYHDPRKASHVSPLYPGDSKDRLNIQYSVKTYVRAGLNPQKIVILLSSYAYLYTLKAHTNGEQAVVKSIQKLSKLSAQEIIERENFFTSWDDARLVPYATATQESCKKWITFNDVESHRRKAEFVIVHQLGGIGVFTVDQDDPEGYTTGGPYPFLWAIVSIVRPEAQLSGYDEPVQYLPALNTSNPSCSSCQHSASDDGALDSPQFTFAEGDVYHDSEDVPYQRSPDRCPFQPCPAAATTAAGPGNAETTSVGASPVTSSSSGSTTASQPTTAVLTGLTTTTESTASTTAPATTTIAAATS